MNKFFIALALVCASVQPIDATQMSNVIKLSEITKGSSMSMAKFMEMIKTGNVIVKCSADWCNPCRQMATHIPALAQEFADVTWMEVDTDMFRELGTAFGIKSIPTLIFFRNGKEIAREVGGKNKQDLRNALKRHFTIK